MSGCLTSHRLRDCRRAFTLVELLVVIGIIALLIAILLPVLARAKKEATALKCAADMRTVYQALLTYTADNKGYLPQMPWIGVRPTQQYASCAITFDADGVANYTFGAILKYLGASPQVRNKVMFCPDDEGVSPFDKSLRRNWSYSFNYEIDLDGPQSATRTLKLAQIRESARKLIIFEERYPNDGFCVWTLWDADALTTRHSGRCNAGFADGHVQRFFPKEIFDRLDYCEILDKKW